ncbi:MAG TPA: lysylphosphatidylglycerol synthase transmembrane domain-containing protein [Anaerolineales bacterium]
MNNAKQATKRPSAIWLRLLPGLLVSVAAIAALVAFVDLSEVQKAFSQVELIPALPLVVALFLGTVGARAMAWRTTLQEQPSFRDSFFVLNQGYLLNNILPFRLGELGRALLLGGRTGLSFWRVLPSIVVERLFDLGFAAILLFSSLPYVIGAEFASTSGVVAVSAVVIVFVVLFVMATRPAWVLRAANFTTRPWPKFQAWVEVQLGHFLEGLSSLKEPARFLRIALWMLLTWVFNLAWYYTLLRVFFGEATWLWASFSIAVASVGVALPSTPSYIGVLEVALVGSLSLLGADESVALAYALVAHVIYFVVTAILGIIGFWQQGQSLGSIYNQLLSRSEAK